MQQAIIIMPDKIAEVEGREADILIRPDVGGIAVNGFGLRDQAVAAEAATLAQMSEIIQFIAERSQQKRQPE